VLEQNSLPPSDQFLLVEEAAAALNVSGRVLRQGIACGLVPIRRDNTGVIRIHLSDVQNNWQEELATTDVQSELHAVTLADEVLALEKNRASDDALRSRLEALVVKQGDAIARYSALIDNDTQYSDTQYREPEDTVYAFAQVRETLEQRDNEVEKLTKLLERTFQAMHDREQQVTHTTEQLSGATEKAIALLARAVHEGEMSDTQLQLLQQQIDSAAGNNARLERELEQRRDVIDHQNGLMERMVTLAEQSATGVTAQAPPKRSFWQWLFRGGKGL